MFGVFDFWYLNGRVYVIFVFVWFYYEFVFLWLSKL